MVLRYLYAWGWQKSGEGELIISSERVLFIMEVTIFSPFDLKIVESRLFLHFAERYGCVLAGHLQKIMTLLKHRCNMKLDVSMFIDFKTRIFSPEHQTHDLNLGNKQWMLCKLSQQRENSKWLVMAYCTSFPFFPSFFDYGHNQLESFPTIPHISFISFLGSDSSGFILSQSHLRGRQLP